VYSVLGLRASEKAQPDIAFRLDRSQRKIQGEFLASRIF
jgi:hypothetical protein